MHHVREICRQSEPPVACSKPAAEDRRKQRHFLTGFIHGHSEALDPLYEYLLGSSLRADREAPERGQGHDVSSCVV